MYGACMVMLLMLFTMANSLWLVILPPKVAVTLLCHMLRLDFILLLFLSLSFHVTKEGVKHTP